MNQQFKQNQTIHLIQQIKIEQNDISCPITYQILSNPSVTKTGHVWEHSIMEQLISISNQCPLTKTMMSLPIESILVKQIVNGFVQSNPLLESEQFIQQWDQNQIIKLMENILNLNHDQSNPIVIELIELINKFPIEQRIITTNNIYQLISNPLIAQLLIELNISIDDPTNGNCLSHWICAYASKSNIKKLFEQRPLELKIPNYSGENSLHVIFQRQSDPDLIRWCWTRWIELGFDLESKTKLGANLLHLISDSESDPELIGWCWTKWIELGLKLNEKNNAGEHGLHLISGFQSDPDLIRWCWTKWIELGLDLDGKNNSGWNLLHLISQYQTDSDLIKWCWTKWIELGLNLDSEILGWTALILISISLRVSDPELFQWCENILVKN
jgi:hypothetical protein